MGYLTEVRWSGNPSQGITNTLRIRLEREGRADYKIENWNTSITGQGACAQPMFGQQRLKRIWVETLRRNSTSDWDVLRMIQLSYHNPTNSNPTQNPSDPDYHSRLENLQHYGKDTSVTVVNGVEVINNSLLYSETFSYVGDRNAVRLAWAENGFGGRIEYSYGYEELNPSDPNSCNGCSYSYYYRPVQQTTTYDGLGNSFVTSYAYAGVRGLKSNNDGFEYLGHEFARSTVNALNHPGAALRTDRTWFYQVLTPSTLDPRRGKPRQSDLWQGQVEPNGTGSGFLLQKNTLNWATTTYTGTHDNGTGIPWNWVRKTDEATYLAGFNSDTLTATLGYTNSVAYSYDDRGNITRTLEYSGSVGTGNAQELRRTDSEYANATNTWWSTLLPINLPARVRLYDPTGTCVAENRTIYWDTNSANNQNNQDGTHLSAAQTPLVAKQEQALQSCAEPNQTTIARNDPLWSVARQAYDAFGNPTVSNLTGVDDAHDDITYNQYDSFYHLFPVKRYKVLNGVEYAETASYYGVNGNGAGGDYGSNSAAVSDAKAFWGQMAEFCAMNEVCTRQSYDSFGRPLLQWQGLTTSSGWGDASTAHTLWQYILRNSSTQSATTVIEQHNPVTEGNFTRQLYNGLGQMVQEQRPNYNWSKEVIVDTIYDALGRAVTVTVPYSVTPYAGDSANYLRPANLTYGATRSEYDAVGRESKRFLPNKEELRSYYNERKVSQRSLGATTSASDDRITAWQEVDGLGNLRNLRTWNNTSVGMTLQWTLASELLFHHDLKGNLHCVYHPAIGSIAPTLNASNDPDCDGNGNPKLVTRMLYDLAGRKTSMNDPDLASWGYSYDRQGRLSLQADACGNLTELVYDGLGRVKSKILSQGGMCSNNPTDPYTLDYRYDGVPTPNNRSRGALVDVAYSDERYRKSLRYNAQGLLASETVTITPSAPGYTTQYGYDQWLRPTTTTQPDGDVVSVSYSGAGQQATLQSSQRGLLVDQVSYDEAGRLSQLRLYGGMGRWPLYRRQLYHPWTTQWNGGQLSSITVSELPDDSPLSLANKRLNLRLYTYDHTGNIKSFSDGTVPLAFAYDHQNRMTTGYKLNQTSTPVPSDRFYEYGYDPSGRLTSYEGISLTTPSSLPLHALQPLTGTTSYLYNANGNVIQRGGQTLTWDAENRLVQVMDGSSSENYLYDADGQRVWKTNGITETFYINPNFEVTRRVKPTYNFTWYDELFPLNSDISSVNNLNWSWRVPSVSTVGVISGSNALESHNFSTFSGWGYEYGFLRKGLADLNGVAFNNFKPVRVLATDDLTFYVYLDRNLAITDTANDIRLPKGFEVWWCAEPLPTVVDNNPWPDVVMGDQSSGGVCYIFGWGVLKAHSSMEQPMEVDIQPLTWTEVKVPASALVLDGKPLVGRKLIGMRFRITNGRAWYDTVGKEADWGEAATEVTKYYSFNGQRIAMSKNDELYYLHSDHLGSIVAVTNRFGDFVTPSNSAYGEESNGEQRYRGYGNSRPTFPKGPVPTDYGFTGQKGDATGLVYMNARYFDPQIGAFVSPDTIVPDPSNVIDYNRYLYGLGNPIKFVDPSGHDPLDAAWQAEFQKVHGRSPTAEDIILRLYSLAFPNQWNWSSFYKNDGSYIAGSIDTILGDAAMTGISWNDVPNALNSLSGWYKADENNQFVRDVGTLFGGLLNRFEEPDTWKAVNFANNPARKWVYVSQGNVSARLVGDDRDNNIHHWAWGIVLGGSQYGWFGEEINTGREYKQWWDSGTYWGSYANSSADIRMGNAGVKLGRIWSVNGIGNIEQDLAVSFIVGTWGSFGD